MPWEAIKYVSSGLTLVAFLVAAIVVVLKSKIRETERLIKTASEGDRAGLVKDALEFFSVDTSNLSKQRQFDVAMAQIQARQLRFTLIISAVIALALIGACLAAYAMSKTANGNGTTVIPSSEHSPSPIDTQKEQFRLLRRTELIGLIFETTDGPNGKSRPRANARTRGEALKEFVEMERLAKRTVPEPDFMPDLRGARLDGVKLEYIDFSTAGFEGANLEGADFYFCNFSNAVLYKTTANEVRFFDCDLTGAHCQRVIWPKAKLTHTTLASADFQGADLQGAVMDDVILKGTNFASSILRGATLKGMRHWLELASIKDADIREAVNAPTGFVEWAAKAGAVVNARTAGSPTTQ